MANGYWAGDSIAQSIERAGDRARANAELAKAERWHAGTLAVMRAAVAELRRVDPANPLLVGQVFDHIDAAGENAYRKGGFKAVRALQLSPAAILADLLAQHEARRQQTLTALHAEPIQRSTVAARWWTPWRRQAVWCFFGARSSSPQQGEFVKHTSCQLARCAGLDDELDPKALAAAASLAVPVRSGLCQAAGGPVRSSAGTQPG